ncbi:MAG: hypothetical protein ACI4MG_00675 [Aristaeellaceae bacterium]
MNQGRPPYGDPSQWGQQPSAGQGVQGQYTPGQMPAQGSYQQPYGQAPYGQAPYGQQPYPQDGAQNPYPQGPYEQPQMYQPQTHQAPESYAQQSWQPYGQQAYGQADNPMYQQAQQNGQPLQQGYYQQPQQPVPGMYYPAQGYSGYVSSSQEAGPSGPAVGEVLMKVALFGVLPVLFILGVLLKAPVLCWLYIAGAAVSIALMWLRDIVGDRLRLIATVVGGVLAAVALVTALIGAPADPVTQQSQGTVSGGSVSGGSGTGMVLEETATPTLTPTLTPDPYAETGAALEVLQSFFYYWHVNNDEAMLELCAPSWRSAQSNPLEALFAIRLTRTPEDDCEITLSGSEADTMRTAKVKVTIDKHNNRTPQRYAFNVILLKEDGVWYIDPRSLESNETESATTPKTNPTATQPVRNTGAPNLTLYYNPRGGSYYHIDGDCDRVNATYKPMVSFLYSQVNQSPYSALDPCPYCSAPARE